MKSIFVKILFGFTSILIVFLAGLTWANRIHKQLTPGHHDYFARSLSFQANQASLAFETGGKAGLARYIQELNDSFPGNHVLIDGNGIDVLTGKNLSAEVHVPTLYWGTWKLSSTTNAWRSRDGKYRLLIDTPPPLAPSSPTPYYLCVVAAVIGCCYILAVQLASPLRALKDIVERFGRGDLGVRASSSRRDEFGNLAREFNLMAERIEVLLTAERRLLQDVSHELRSPLARLEFAVELARTNPDRNNSLNRIKKEVERLGDLVNELLQVTRAENDPASRDFKEVSLAALLSDVVDDNRVEAEAHGCKLKIDANQAIIVSGDRELLRRAVENIVRNSIRYAPKDSAVEVHLSQRGRKALIQIRDHGPGVPDKALENLFRPFFRVEADRNRNSGGGVGLGLSIAERAISVHQGSISARNAEPGLLIEIVLPSLKSAQAA
jgi:signal transduction histidine kinase